MIRNQQEGAGVAEDLHVVRPEAEQQSGKQAEQEFHAARRRLHVVNRPGAGTGSPRLPPAFLGSRRVRRRHGTPPAICPGHPETDR